MVNLWVVRALPQTPLGELTVLPRLPSWRGGVFPPARESGELTVIVGMVWYSRPTYV